MKRKNLMTLLLALTLVSSSLAGCSSGSTQTAPEADTTAVSGTPAQETSVQEASIPETGTDTGSDTQTAQAPMYPLPDAAEDAGIYVEPIPDISDDFIRGMDVSSILVEEKSGVKYYGADGAEQDVFTTMAQAGVNYARIRVWNDRLTQTEMDTAAETMTLQRQLNLESVPPQTA